MTRCGAGAVGIFVGRPPGRCGLMFSVFSSRARRVCSVHELGCHLRIVLVIDRKRYACFAKAGCIQVHAFHVWMWFVCLGFAALFPWSLHSQTVTHHQAAQSANVIRTYRAGLALAEGGKLDAAIAAFKQALESDPLNRSLLDATGAAYSLKGDFEQAEQYFLQCLNVDPGFVPARKNLAIDYFSLGRYELAAAEFQKLTGVSPSSRPLANLFLGMIAERNADDARAATLLNGSGALLRRYPNAVLSLAEAQFHLKHFQRVQVTLDRFDTSQGITAAQYLKAAELYSQLGENKKAMAELDKATAKDGRLQAVAYRRAAVLEQMSRSREALAILSSLAGESPNGDTLNLLARVAQETGDLKLALDSLRQAAKLDPTREDNYLDFSTICADYGNYPLALEATSVGLDHIPNSYRLLVQKGVVLENLGRIDEAEEALRTAGQLQKDNSVALLSLAIVQTHAGQLQDAKNTLSSALVAFPDNYYMHYHLGKILVQLQENNPNDDDLSTQAKHAFQQAIRCNPSYADSYYQLSKLYLRESPKLAEENLVKCLRLDPHHKPAEYTLARLYLSTGRRAAGQALVDRFERQQQADKLKESQQPRIEAAER
jgi:tetratricopeptide (TPR) repeat protein